MEKTERTPGVPVYRTRDGKTVAALSGHPLTTLTGQRKAGTQPDTSPGGYEVSTRQSGIITG